MFTETDLWHPPLPPFGWYAAEQCVAADVHEVIARTVASIQDPAVMLRIVALGPQIDLIHRELGPEAVHTLLRYVTSALPPSSALRDTILDVITEEERAMYMSVYDEIRAEGRTEGHTEGRAAGKLELLLKLLAQRGLVLDGDLRARVAACTNEAQLERWFDRALAATSVATIFDEP